MTLENYGKVYFADYELEDPRNRAYSYKSNCGFIHRVHKRLRRVALIIRLLYLIEASDPNSTY